MFVEDGVCSATREPVRCMNSSNFTFLIMNMMYYFNKKNGKFKCFPYCAGKCISVLY